ncbi:MAG: S8 family serine peptidase [Candidatus Lokiarchaeota archaeon]|nr:S8 family serine peptidase [Candidatus Lokiarchaeota archaeon]
MNKKRIALVLFLAAAMSLSMCFAPMVPVAQAEDNALPSFTPEQVQEIEDFYNKVESPDFVPEVHHLISSWLAGEDVTNKMVMRDGMPSIMIYGTANMDVDRIEEIVDVSWKADLRALQVVKAYLPSADSVDALLAVDGVATISADEKAFAFDDLNKNIDVAPVTEPGLDMEQVADIVNANDMWTDYTGAGVTVGHVDTGCDFGHPALQHAFHPDSYDPSGYAITPTYYHANSSEVTNMTAWEEMGYLLTYEDSGSVYVNVTGWDPTTNNNGGPRSLMGLLPPFGDGYPYGSNIGFVGLYEWAWGISNASEFVANELWKDWELPSGISGDYQLGWIFQQKQGPYTKMFAPALVFNNSGTWNLVIDWEGAEGWSAFWNGAMYWESLDLNDTADRTMITDLFDWSFADDYADGDIYSLASPIVAEDIDGDSIVDLSLGALAWTYDDAGWFSDELMFQGFRSDGDAISLYFDFGTHGTATAAHVAARDTTEMYYQADNDKYVNFTGIAPDAEILSVASITAGGDYGAYLWICGFDYNSTLDEFYYNPSSTHQSDLTTNSWGWITEPSSEFNYLSLTWTILSVPGYLDPSYPGVFHVFSAGNEGAGFMTGAPPGSSPGVLTVGASTASEWLGYLYGDTQPYANALASFTSKGPNFSGYPKPDVVAPGLADYSANPWHGQYLGQYYYPSPYGYVPTANTTLFSGTSQAAPIAAGVAALVVDALGSTPAPSRIKTIMQSTADDLGYDPATQGFGLVNAQEACGFADGTGINFIGETVDSMNNYADMLDEAWNYWGTISGLGVSVNKTAFDHPRDINDASIFFGYAMPGETLTAQYKVYAAADHSTVMAGAGTVYNWFPTYAESFSFDGVTDAYNDTAYMTDPYLMYGFYNISAEMNDPAFDTALDTYDYMTVVVSFDAGDVAGAEPWMFLYDWTDNNTDGMPNAYNQTTGSGDELDRLTSASGPTNVNMMPYAVNTGVLGITHNYTLVIHDPVFDVNQTAVGNDFTCKIIFWDMLDIAGDPSVTITADDGTPNTYNISMDLPADQEAGILQGYLELDTFGLYIPWSVNVVANVSTTEGAVKTVVDGFGEVLTPFDAPMYGCLGADVDDWDFRSFTIYNNQSTANYLGVRVEWPTTGNSMYVELLRNNGLSLASNGASTDTSSAIIADISNTGMGYYHIFLHATALNGTADLPGNYTVEVMWYEALNDDVILTYTTTGNPSPTTFADGETLTGDHIVLNATYPDFNLPNMPEFEVTDMEMSLLSGLYEVKTGSLVIPDASYDPFSGVIDTDQFAWAYVEGIKDGDTVDIVADFSNGDCDIMVWWADIDNGTWTYGNNLVEDQMASSAHPEIGQFVADQDGTIAIGIFDYDLQEGTYEVEVDTRTGQTETATGRTVTFDTYQMLKNGAYQVLISAETKINLAYSVNLLDLTLNNLIAPELENITINGDGAIKNIDWNITDPNLNDEHIYEIYLSQDGGLTYQLLSSGFKTHNYTWNSTGFVIRSTYKVRVVVFDNDTVDRPAGFEVWPGLSDQIESGLFEAGTYTPPEPTTSTSTSTSDTTTTTEAPPGVDLLWIGLFGGIGTGVVIVLILYLVKKK